jgi:hypothetical protein
MNILKKIDELAREFISNIKLFLTDIRYACLVIGGVGAGAFALHFSVWSKWIAISGILIIVCLITWKLDQRDIQKRQAQVEGQ